MGAVNVSSLGSATGFSNASAGRAVDPDGPIEGRTPYPWWVDAINGVGRISRKVGRRWPRLDPDEMTRAATRRTGLKDFGDERFREGLHRFVASFETQDDAHAFGRHFFREYCVGLLANRLKIEEEFRLHPEINDVPLARPIVVTGLPRSGTTFLHRLLSEDPNGRTLLFWETLEPAPAPRPGNYLIDKRIARSQKSIDLIYKISPRIPAAHHFAAAEPEECNNLFAHDFGAGMNGFMFDVPDYMHWLEAQDRVPGYRSMRRQLQLLSLHVRRDYWVLKAPAHLYGIDALLEVYPDACVVQTHRDPLKVLPSVCSLAAGFRGIIADPIDLRRLGEEFVEAMSKGPNMAMKARETLDPARFLDVRYDSLIADPLGTVQQVCRYFGYDFSAEYEARTRRYLAENPQHKHGVHRYRLEDFGLDAETVNRHFAGYRAWVARKFGQAV